MVKPRFKFDAFADFAKERQVAQSEMKRYASSGSLVAFQPDIYGSTNPTYYKATGASSVPAAEALRAAYIRHDDHFTMWFSFAPGTSFTAGTGAWTMSVPPGVTLPDTASTLLYANIGTWHGYRAASNALAFGPIWVNNASTIRFLYPATYPGGTATSVGAAAPWAWASGCSFGGFVSFPIM